MLQKAIIEKKIDKYLMKVRIPVYNKIKSDPTATPTEDLYNAIIQTLPGCSPVYQEGDLVLVEFENDNIANPVIIGLLYRQDMLKGSTDIVADSLHVNVNTTLSENTSIGYVTPESIKKLDDKYTNNVKKVVVEYSLSNYEDHYDQFSQWSEQAPQFWPGKFMWQRTTVTYENDLITRSMTCIQGAEGQPGTSITIVTTYVKYAISSSGTTHPSTSDTWYENPPQTTDVSPYLWSWTYVLYSDGTSTNTFSVARTSANSIIVYLYKRSASEITHIDWSQTLTYDFDTKQFVSLPTGWFSDIPSGNDPIYMTAATASSVGSQGEITASSWSTPILFTKSGFNSKTIQLYKRSATVPSAPTTSVVYTFSTGGLSPASPNGWSVGVPASDGNPCYVVQATAISYEDTDTVTSGEWSTPTVIVQDGNSDYIDQPIVDWYKATTNTTIPTTPTTDIEIASEWTTLGWTNDISSITLSETNKYLWNAEVTHYSISGYVKTNAHIITIYSESGAGILSSTIYYFVDIQGATPPSDSAAWSTTFPSSIQQGQYLWTKTVTQYTDVSIPDSVVYSVSRDGETGSDGKGITSIVEYYAINDSDTNPPASGSSDWKTTPMNPTSEKRYLWSYQKISYTTGNPTTTTPHVISMYAEDGAAGSSAATVFLYQRAASSSSLNKPATNLTYTFSTGVLSGNLGGWSQTIPATDGNPCFVIQATAISTGTTDTIQSSEWSNIVKLIEDGQDGTGITSSAIAYAVSSSGSTVPESGWSPTFPSNIQQGDYLWTRTITSYSDGTSSTSYSVSRDGTNGTNGTNGLNNAVVYLYKRSNSVASVDWTTTFTYNFSNKRLTSVPTGWSESVPSGTYPIYVTAATASSRTNTDTIPYTEWSGPVVLAENGNDGTNGLNTATVFLYQRAASASSLNKPSSNLTYTFSTGVLSGALGNWSQTFPPVSGNPCFVIQATAISNTSTDIIKASEWSDITKIVEDGEDGVGITSSSVMYATSSNGSTAPETGWQPTVPTVSQGEYLWTRTITTYSDSTSSTSYSVSRNAINGTNGLNTAIVYLYKRSTTAATIDWTNTLTYNFSNKSLTSTPSGWSQTVPTGTAPVYITAATASSNTTTDTIAYTEWSTPVVFAQNGTNGTDGMNTATVFLYKRAESSSSLSKPSSNLTYTFSTGILSGTLGGWSQKIPATDGNPCFVIQATAVGTGTTDTIAPSEWSNIVELVSDGQDGTNGISITGVTEYFATNNSDTTAPTSGWSTSFTAPTASEKYVWNYERITYSSGDPTDTTPAIIGMYSADGNDGRSITGVVNYYLATNADSGVTISTPGWTTTVQSVSSSEKYLWNYEVVNYDSGTPTTTTPCIIGAYGDTGAAGANGLNNAVIYLYKRSSSTVAVDWTDTLTYTFATHTLDIIPTGWNSSIPSGTDPLYVTAATASSNTGTDTIAYTEWATPVILAENGATGSDGANSATVFLYQRANSSSSISKPSGALTYTFATGTLSGTLGNWTQTIPTSDGNPCFVIQATAVSSTATDTIQASEWSNIVELVSDGTDGSPGTNGLNNAIVYLYKRSSTAATIDWTSTLTYDFTNKSLTSTPEGWSETIPSGTNPIYVTAASASSNTNTDTILYTEWSQPVVLAQNGANGRSITNVTNYYLATDQDSGVTRSTSGWTTTIQNVTSTNKYLWNYEEITYSSGNPTYTDPCIIGAYGDNGQTGVGISSIVEYYALSTTTVRPTSGWSTELPSMDSVNRYLWNYSVITYTNGTSSGSQSDALIIGVYGDSVLSLEIQSDNGTLFNSKTISTTLTPSVYLGSAQLAVSNAGVVSQGGTTIGQINWFAKEQLKGNGEASTFDLGLDILNYSTTPNIQVKINGTVTSAYTISDENTIVFNSAPVAASIITIEYLTSTSGSLTINRTDVRNQIVITCKIVQDVETLAVNETTVKDLNDATSIKNWYMLTVANAQFVSLPTVIYNPEDAGVVPTGSYTYQQQDDTTQQYETITAQFTWLDVAPVVNSTNLNQVCYSFQMIIFFDNSCSAGEVQRDPSFDSGVSSFLQGQAANDAASQAQNTANDAASGVQDNASQISGIQGSLQVINDALIAKVNTVQFDALSDNINAFMRFDIQNSILTLGKQEGDGARFYQEITPTKNSFKEGETEVAYISNQELYINNTTINQKLAFDEQWIVTFDSTDGLIIKHI